MTEVGNNLRHGRTSRCRQLMGNHIGVDQRRSLHNKQIGNRAFTTPDTASQTDDKAAHWQFCALLPGMAPATSLRKAG